MDKHVCPVHLVSVPSTGYSRHVLKTLYKALPGKLTFRQHTQHTIELLTARSSFLQAYRDIETSIVTENVFSQYMYKTLPVQLPSVGYVACSLIDRQSLTQRPELQPGHR